RRSHTRDHRGPDTGDIGTDVHHLASAHGHPATALRPRPHPGSGPGHRARGRPRWHRANHHAPGAVPLGLRLQRRTRRRDPRRRGLVGPAPVDRNQWLLAGLLALLVLALWFFSVALSGDG